MSESEQNADSLPSDNEEELGARRSTQDQEYFILTQENDTSTNEPDTGESPAKQDPEYFILTQENDTSTNEPDTSQSGTNAQELDTSGSADEVETETQESGAGIQEPDNSIQEPGAGIQEPGANIQEPGANIQKPGVCTQEPDTHENEVNEEPMGKQIGEGKKKKKFWQKRPHVKKTMEKIQSATKGKEIKSPNGNKVEEKRKRSESEFPTKGDAENSEQTNTKTVPEETENKTRAYQKEPNHFTFPVNETIESHPLQEEDDDDNSDYGSVMESSELKFRLLEVSEETRSGTPTVHRLPETVTFENEKTEIRRCIIGFVPETASEKMAEEKVIFTVGATGAGKTTLVNGMVNYALGVEWDDPFRFELVLDKKESANQALKSSSQTSWVTAYTLYPGEGSRIPYILTIVDTPGFGDTQGLQKDEELLKKLRNLFETKECSVDCLHGVCFVAQSSLARLTPCQKYVFDGVLSIFGKDVADNIFMLLTFSDAMPPPVVNAITDAKLPYREFFKFNNSSLFADNASESTDRVFNEMFWKMGFSSFERFFAFIFNKVKPVSLTLTVSVLDKRERLQVYIAGLQENITKGICTLNEINQEKEIVKDRERDIDRNKDFAYHVIEDYTLKVDKQPGQHVTNCQFCHRTCHTNCVYANDEDKKKCAAMDKEGYCTVCQPKSGDKCSWDVHYNMKYYFVWKQRDVEKRAEDLYEKYEIAKGQKAKAEDLVAKINEKFESIQAIVLAQTNEVRKCLITLSEIALKPNPLTTCDYIDQMISAEKMGGELGWQQRVEQLQQARVKAQYLQKLSDDGYDPFEEARKSAEIEEEQQTRTVTKREGRWKSQANMIMRLFTLRGDSQTNPEPHESIEMEGGRHRFRFLERNESTIDAEGTSVDPEVLYVNTQTHGDPGKSGDTVSVADAEKTDES